MTIPVVTTDTLEGYKTSGVGKLLSTTVAANMKDYYASDSEKIENAKHLYELEKDNYLSLSIDGAMRGVGGDMPGVATLRDAYKLKPGKSVSFKFRISKI